MMGAEEYLGRSRLFRRLKSGPHGNSRSSAIICAHFGDCERRFQEVPLNHALIEIGQLRAASCAIQLRRPLTKLRHRQVPWRASPSLTRRAA